MEETLFKHFLFEDNILNVKRSLKCFNSIVQVF